MLEPILCGQISLAPLIPKLRGHFAEFLNNASPAGLRILSSSTCVGLRYGHMIHNSGFSRQLESDASLLWFGPRTRKALKNSLKITATKGWRRFWYDLHVAGGMYTLIFLLAMALTGLTWSFPWYRTAFYKVFGVEVQQRAAQGHEQKSDAQKRDTKLAAHREKKREGNEVRKGERSRRPENNHSDMYSVTSPFVYWQEIYDKLRRQNPEYKQISISSGTASVSFNRFGNQRASDRYSFNTDNGEFTETSLYQHQDKSGKIRGWIYSVHVGNWGGMFTRILTFIAALLGAALPLTGYYLWIKRLIKVRK